METKYPPISTHCNFDESNTTFRPSSAHSSANVSLKWADNDSDCPNPPMRITFCESSELGGRSRERWHLCYLYFAPLLSCHSKLILHDLSDSFQRGHE